MTKRLLLPRSQAVGLDGRPLAGAKLYTFVTGTSTPKAVFTDAGLSVPHANPVIADAAGRFPAMFLGLGDYRTVLTDAADATIATDDPVEGASLLSTVTPYSATLLDDIDAAAAKATLNLGMVRSWQDFGIAADNTTDDTAAVQAAFDWLDAGRILIMPSARIRITGTLTIGNGTNTSFSTRNQFTIIWGGGGPTIDAMINVNNPNFGVSARMGTVFRWAGANGGTMFRINGPIFGLRWIGIPSFDGVAYGNGTTTAAGAGKCVEIFSMQNSHLDGIHAYNWQAGAGNRGIYIGSRFVSAINGSFTELTSASNVIGDLTAFAPDATDGECIRFDGLRAAGGMDFTVSTIHLLRCGVCRRGGQGLVLGYTDNLLISKIVNTGYRTASGNPAGILLDYTATPFPYPAQILIGQCSPGEGLSVTGQAAGGVHIQEYLLDDSGVVPATSVAGFSIGRLNSSTSAVLNGLPWQQAVKVRAENNLDGIYAYAGNGNHRWSLTRWNENLHIASAGNARLELTQTGVPNGLSFQYEWTPTQYRHTGDNAASLGNASNRWSTVFAATGTINTSDALEKANVDDVADREMRAWGRVRAKVFQFNDAVAEKGNAARLHVGLVAQDVAAAFEAEGLDPARYALWCRDEWDEVDEITGATIRRVRQGLRYDQCMVLEAAWSRSQIATLTARVDELAAQIAALGGK